MLPKCQSIWHRQHLNSKFFAIIASVTLFLASDRSKFRQALHVSAATQCADSIQRCGAVVDEFERQIDALKKAAFKRCFLNKACTHERVAFDDCFTQSIQAIRAPFSDSTATTTTEFVSAAEGYRTRIDKCFSEGGATGAGQTGESDAERRQIESILTSNPNNGEDIVYARAVFGHELDDQLWGLEPRNMSAGAGPQQQQIPLTNVARAVCSVTLPGSNRRLFGGGISRLVEPSPGQTNLNTSCTLAPAELDCYQQALDSDPEYQLLTGGFNKALRSCIQKMRNGAVDGCRRGPITDIRGCVCDARAEFESHVETALLDCVRNSNVAQLYTALVRLSGGGGDKEMNDDGAALVDSDTSSGRRHKKVKETPVVTSAQLAEESMTVPASTTLTQGSLVSGQCMCACPKPAQTYTVCVPRTVAQTSASVDAKPGTNVAVAAAQPKMPWYYRPLNTVYSTEAGIAKGFENFFSGLPPVRRRRRSVFRSQKNS